MSWFDELSPAINNTRPLIKTEKDLAKLTPPDPEKDGRMPFVKDILQLFHEKELYIVYILNRSFLYHKQI